MKLNERSVAHYATCDSPPDKTGFLFKKGERNTAYHRRWFVLKGNMLFYFEERDSREPIGVIVLEGCTVELCESVEEFAFAIKFDCAKARVYKLAAENQVAMESWVKALSRASFDYMRLVVKELERQLEEIQDASGAGGQQGRPKPSRRNQMARSKSAASSSSSSSSSLSTSSSAPSMSAVYSAQKSLQDEVQLIPGNSRENGVAWSKPPSASANGSGEAAPSCVTWDGSTDSGIVTGCGADGGRAPPVPPRRLGASLESPVSPDTGCFSKLHDWYGREVEELRVQWLQSQ
ncbi:PREDICTED: sesquipedalian-1 [Cyprinodon variegatus]|uniref:sesquipedalian-1 n=1 Tax=Cyprinodon variegatus TaxID=28743 RepID=UPI000742661D|nr:PREDICTED: sesquipedalian-1 [Cyprinodon variegatus]XP_015232651.1 PREDICTED: sesquipedalian-1 [Cyprinodon variegatus]XP_015232652.1 PREDICTED: sesquipedalian-1 [Cyprinodon variegatus]XP_015232653.1 PREDICTED: sesquipedalian-1 [Cyprinodon variegatus]